MEKNKELKYIKSVIMFKYIGINRDLNNGTLISTIGKIINYLLDKIVKYNYNYCGSEIEIKGNTNLMIIMEA